MKLEVGMYVRTNEGIKKIEDYNYHEELPDNPYDFNKHHIYKQNIIKASNHIIDLIEVGDYVNGMLVMSNDYNFDRPIKIFNYLRFGKEDIKSILTHEQMEANAYTIEKER